MEQEDWLNALYETHHTAVFRFAYSILHDIPMAEDVMQDTFVKAYGGYRRYQERGPA